MNKHEELKNILNFEKKLLISNLNLTALESIIIVKIVQLYLQTNDVNLIKWVCTFLGVTICSSFTFDYIKDEYNKNKKELIYTIGDKNE